MSFRQFGGSIIGVGGYVFAAGGGETEKTQGKSFSPVFGHMFSDDYKGKQHTAGNDCGMVSQRHTGDTKTGIGQHRTDQVGLDDQHQGKEQVKYRQQQGQAQIGEKSQQDAERNGNGFAAVPAFPEQGKGMSQYGSNHDRGKGQASHAYIFAGQPDGKEAL